MKLTLVQKNSPEASPSPFVAHARPESPADQREDWPTPCSLSAMTGNGPAMRQPWPQQKWEFLFHQLVLFAHYQIKRLNWRGDASGILPEGYDANSLAAQAIFEFLAAHNSLVDPANTNDALGAVLWELKRTVLRHVTRLHHRKENWLLSNSDDLAPVQIDDGEMFNPIELIPDPGSHPDAILIGNESLAAVESTTARFRLSITHEPRLCRLFDLLSDGIEKPQALAASLKLRRSTVHNLRQRLRRKWRRSAGTGVLDTLKLLNS